RFRASTCESATARSTCAPPSVVVAELRERGVDRGGGDASGELLDVRGHLGVGLERVSGAGPRVPIFVVEPLHELLGARSPELRSLLEQVAELTGENTD